jgi:hypothetical protein
VDDHQKGRLAENENLFRETNDRIKDSADEHGADSHVYSFLCECSDRTCTERVELTLAEYEHIRADATRFVVKKNHVVKEIEQVVETAADHVVIEKHGEAGRVAIELEADQAG